MKIVGITKTGKYRSGEQGMASIVVVGMLIILLTLISIGFTRIMDRSLQNSAADQQAAAANYGAQSGINAVAAYLTNTYTSQGQPVPGNIAQKCGDILSSSKVNPSLGNNTQITCALVGASESGGGSTSLVYTLNAYDSKTVNLTPSSGAMSSVTFQWTSSGSLSCDPGSFGLKIEPNWGSCPAMLRVTLYPVPGGGSLNVAENSSDTFFFYPKSNGAGTTNVNADKAPLNNTFAYANCNSSTCTMTVTNLQAGNNYYVRLTPLYAGTTITITGSNGNGNVSFALSQVKIDVTAKSGSAVKRLLAYVTLKATSQTGGPETSPRYALRSANTLCKRYVVSATGIATDSSDCYNPNQPPKLNFWPDNSPGSSTFSIPYGTATTLNWSATGGSYPFNKCTGKGGLWGSGRSVSLPPASVSTGNLSSATTYSLTCTNTTYGGTQTLSVTINVTPTVTLTATPTSVDIGGSSTLKWTSKGASSCSAIWTTSTRTSGSQTITNITTQTTYSITCTGNGGSVQTQVTVTINPPKVTLTASPNPVPPGTSTKLTWTVKNATSCSGSSSNNDPNWPGSPSTSGGYVTSQALFAPATYTLTCTGIGGTSQASVTVTLLPPQITFTANPNSVNYGGSSTLTWTVLYATSCTASGDWSGSKGFSGSQSTGSLTSKKQFTYYLSCDGLGGTTTKSATVTINPVKVSISVNPSTIYADGSTSTLSWSSSGNPTNGCSASGSWGGSRGTSGSQTVGPYSVGTYSYTLTCSNPLYSASATATLSVIAVPPHPPISINNFSGQRVWQGPECYSPGNGWHQTWWCYGNGFCPSTTLNWQYSYPCYTTYYIGNPYCADGVHAWTICSVNWSATAQNSYWNDTGTISCSIRSSYGGFTSGGASGSRGPFGWSNSSDPNPFTITCSDPYVSSASYTTNF